VSSLRSVVRRMIVDSGAELSCGIAVKRAKRWSMSDEASRDRVLQCLSTRGPRNFDLDWLPIVIATVLEHGGEDLVVGALSEVVYQARRRRDEDELELLAQHERRGPKRVPASVRRRETA